MLSRSSHVKCWQVSELNAYLKELLASNPFLSSLWVKGEISNLRKPASGHLYFTLKDRQGSIRAVMFRSRAVRLPVPLEDGMEVLLRASLSIYERDGVYQLYVEEAQPLGAGDLHRAFQLLKEQLEKEGLFSPERKKKLPLLPRRIGLVTSATGAAIRDIITILFKRFPYLQVIVAPALVQGVEAPGAIVNAIRQLNRFGEVDVIIVARGGGSLEELWAFNTEPVARAIADSAIPIVTGVGHETDYTIADLAADVRAATPSAAAALVVPDYEQELARLDGLLKRAGHRALNVIGPKRQKLDSIINYSILTRPEQLLSARKQDLELMSNNLRQLMEKLLLEKNNSLALQAKKLESLSPLKVLARGFSICQDEEGIIISSIHQVEPGNYVEVRLRDGSMDCQVVEVKPYHD